MIAATQVLMFTLILTLATCRPVSLEPSTSGFAVTNETGSASSLQVTTILPANPANVTIPPFLLC